MTEPDSELEDRISGSVTEFTEATKTALEDAGVNSEAIEQFSQDTLSILENQNRLIEQLEEQAELRKQENEILREKTVHKTAVESVLLEYNLSQDQVDEIVGTIVEVDEKMWSVDE